MHAYANKACDMYLTQIWGTFKVMHGACIHTSFEAFATLTGTRGSSWTFAAHSMAPQSHHCVYS